MKKIWIVAANRSGARFFSCENLNEKPVLIENVEHPEGRLKEGQLVSDRPGHSMSDASPGGNTFQASVSATQDETRQFATRLADRLEKGAYEKEYESLMLLAEPGFAGVLKSLLGKQAENKLQALIHADYANISDHELQERLSLLLKEELHNH